MQEAPGVPTTEEPVQAQPTTETEEPSVPTTPVVEGEETPQAEDEFPEEPTKQREAFIKMRQEIKALKDAQAPPAEVPTEEEAEILREFRSRQVPIATFNPEMDTTQMSEQLQQVAYQSQAANQRILELEQKLEDERLYAAFPELNPKNPDFKKPENKAFEKYVAGMYLLEKMKGQNPDLVSIARKAKDDFSMLSKPQQAIVQQEIESNLTKVEQATLEAKGHSNNIPEAKTDDEAIRHGARKGDVDSIVSLLRARG